MTLYRRKVDGATVETRESYRGGDYLFARGLGRKTWSHYAWTVFIERHEPISTKSATTPEVQSDAT